MRRKVICCILACAILISVTALPVSAENTEPVPSDVTQPTETTAETTAATDSTQATDPTETTAATEATDPTETTAATDPTETTAPTDPTETTAPAETTAPTDPTETTAPTETTVPTDPTEVTNPTEPDDGTWKVSDEMLRVLKKLEGFAAYAYWDYKQWSIGYGSRCPAGKEKYYQEHPITEEYAEELLRGELDYFEKEVNDFIKEKNLTVTQNQYDALVSFSYNCGANWTTETTGYFHNGVLSGDLGSEFVYGMFLWSTAGGQYVLIPRRISEIYMYSQSKYEHRWLPTDEQYRYVFMDANGGKANYYVHGFDANDPTAIRTKLTEAPTGPDETGATVTYVFDGWYTAREGGTKVEILDKMMTSGSVLYARWKTPSGTPVTIPPTDTGIHLKITVKTDGVNVRSGPQTYFSILGQANKGDELTITEVVTVSGYPWGRFGDSWIRLDYTDYSEVIGDLFPIWGVVTADDVNVRSGAGANNSVVTTKKKGDLVLIKRWVSDGERMWGETDEGYIAMSYVSLEDADPADKEVASITVRQKPKKLQYRHKMDELDLTGGLLQVTYTDGTSQVLNMTSDMVSGFDNTKAGINTVTVTLGDMTTEFNVEIVKLKIKFLMDDGSLIAEKEYLYGAKVKAPKAPEKPGNKEGVYVFVGWDKEVTACAGDAVYTAVYKLVERVGDIDKDGSISDRDAIYLLRHVLFPDMYPFSGTADLNADGSVSDRDAIYLLRHVLFPEMYPLGS